MFLGTHEPRLDEKGRLILPAKFREDLSSGLVITKGSPRTKAPRTSLSARLEERWNRRDFQQ